MKIKLSRKIIIQPIIIVLLIFLFIFTPNIIDKNSSVYPYWKILRSAMLLLAAWLSMKLVTLMFLDPINENRKKNLPNIIKDLIGSLIYFIALSVIITEVYGKTLTSIGAFFISSWAIIGFAAKDIIAECIYGIYLDFQADFEVGDWIQFNDGTVGKIIKMKMTGLEILLQNNTVLFINNTLLSHEPIVNLSKPEHDYYASINLSIDFTVPISQATKILSDAMKGISDININDFKVFADSIQENGVVYIIHFKVPDQSSLFEIRHQVLQRVTEHLRKINLNMLTENKDLNKSHQGYNF